MNYKHFTIEERALLESYKIQGLTNQKCVKRWNKHKSTIFKKLKHCQVNKNKTKQAVSQFWFIKNLHSSL